MTAPESSFFVTGGTLRADAPSYVERQADRDLFDGLRQGEFCYVLTSRQMGKSSLMVRTAGKLRAEGMNVVVLDLTAIGQNLKPEQWYNGLLLRLGQQLALEDNLEQFWHANEQLGSCQRFFTAIREVVLPHLARTHRPSSVLRSPSSDPGTPGPPGRESPSPEDRVSGAADHSARAADGGPETGDHGTRTMDKLTVFVDEIDAVRSLPFATGEFFAAVRECYNRRSQDPEFNRLTFCLLGVATPTDLIRDAQTTPFNVGRRIELNDFSEREVAPLAIGLRLISERVQPPDPRAPRRMLERVLYWTGGQPYLTQRLCRAVAEAAPDSRWLNGSEEFVDQLCTGLFLSTGARDRDDNLIFVRERLLRADADLPALLELYRRVLEGKNVPDDPANPLTSILRLSGIVRVYEGEFDVRNRIYRHVFDRNWVATNMPHAEVRRQRRAFRRGLARGMALAALVLGVLAVSFAIHRRHERARQVENTILNLGTAYQRLRTYQDSAEIRVDIRLEGADLTANGACALLWERPNRLNFALKMKFGLTQTELRLIYDGRTLWKYYPPARVYVTEQTEGGILPKLQEQASLAGLATATATLYGLLVTESPQETLAARRAGPIRLLRTELYEGRPACVLAWEQRALDFPLPDAQGLPAVPQVPRFPTTAWVSLEDGLIRQMKLDLSSVIKSTTMPNLSGGAPRMVAIESYVVTIKHNNVRIDEPLAEGTFTFVPPPDAHPVESVDPAAVFSAGQSSDLESGFDRESLARLIPARSPQARAELLDLSSYYNAPLTVAWHSAITNNDLSLLPRGLQRFAGVEFDVRGIVQLAGRAEPYLRSHYPEQVRGILVGQKCRRLHFLHSTGWNAPDGTLIGSYVIRYAEGQRRIVPIYYGFDVRDWWPQGTEPPAALTGLLVAWHGPSKLGDERRLYKSTWENALPQVEISTIDYVSNMAAPAPFLIAITAEP
jgi:hypothetical protein